MANFGANSQQKLLTCHASLQAVLTEAIKHYDFSIVCGTRGKEEQDLAFAKGMSKTQWPFSKHNANPSHAFDIYPYHSKYGSLTDDPTVIKKIQSVVAVQPEAVKQFITQEYCLMAGVIMTVATQVGVKLRWGGDWNCDGNRFDNSFNDLAHFELVD